MFVSGARPRARRGPELPKNCRRRQRQKGKLGRDSQEELLDVAMALARERELGDKLTSGDAAR